MYVWHKKKLIFQFPGVFVYVCVCVCMCVCLYVCVCMCVCVGGVSFNTKVYQHLRGQGRKKLLKSGGADRFMNGLHHQPITQEYVIV